MPKKQDEGCNFKSEMNLLNACEPDRLYFLYGPEDYLSVSYLDALRQRCLPEGDDGFSLKSFEGPELDFHELEAALNSMPFLSDRLFVELHGVDINKVSDGDSLIHLLKDIPDYCTVVFHQDFQFTPDGRTKLTKFLRTSSKWLFFDVQPEGLLVNWIRKRFASLHKQIDREACERLLFVSGTLMNKLIPEITKIAACSERDIVTVADVDAAANHVPEADVFQMISELAMRRTDSAAKLLSELLIDKKTEPIAVLALIGQQVRKLYGTKLALSKGLGRKGVSEIIGTTWEKLIIESIEAAKGFSLCQLSDAVKKCSETDYLMKSSSIEDTELLKELFFRLI